MHVRLYPADALPARRLPPPPTQLLPRSHYSLHRKSDDHSTFKLGLGGARAYA